MTKRVPFLLSLVVLFCFTGLSSLYAQGIISDLPKEKQTTLELYVTSKEAYEKWRAHPDHVKILDVRTPEEYMYIGHAAMAWNIPAFIQTYTWDAEKEHFSMIANPDFISQIKETFQPTDTILVTCRSGGRSALAVNQLAAAGYKNVFNITDGFEGDKVKDENSVYNNKRMVNGWKNSGAPWTYEVSPEKMILPVSK